MTSLTNSDLGGAPRPPPLLWSHPPPRLPTRQLQELLNCGCGICQREWVFLVEQTQTLLRALKRVRNPTVAYPFDTCVCLHNCDALENAYATHHNPQSDFGFFEGRYDFAAELASGRAQEAQEAVNAALCRQPISTAPHTEETIRSWNEAKALFEIAPDEEPGQIPVEAIAYVSRLSGGLGRDGLYAGRMT
ncbi:hypothetical protein K466DRAFT_189453 [Polyporus arcularius HHB13444]|uniref:Uncharacterized protein n=1 Tax=Polyporus arcularius HHB13444 TaxID=1314778 RepID=A0A5C3P6W6_9APHY|nr:hypothetical protein K466DRAFT_189453 [Polyporus arcularius HHB13444]